MSSLLRLLALSALCVLVAIPVWAAYDVDDDDETGGVVIYGPPAPVAPAVVARDEAGRVTVRATRISEAIVIDGKLDDEVYARVVPMSGFIQQEPNEGAPATEKTESWVFFDDNNVYITARCWDSHPERMIINEMRRDNSNIRENASFTVVLDTFYDRRNGFFFQTNPLGALRDQAVGDEGQSNNNDWNTVWDVGASVFEQGWIAEIVIPFKSLRYKKGRDQIWSINLRRTVQWKNEESFLSPVAASHRYRGIYRFSEAATLVGIQAPVSSRNLELKPYGITSMITDNNAKPRVSNDVNADVGFDLKYGLTKSLIADFTYNTDFAQIEEDQQQVNLTRFSLFFPEKRDFFLEGQNIFAFAGVRLRGGGSFRPGRTGRNLTPVMFFSRRIGLTADGVDPIIIRWSRDRTSGRLPDWCAQHPDRGHRRRGGPEQLFRAAGAARRVWQERHRRDRDLPQHVCVGAWCLERCVWNRRQLRVLHQPSVERLLHGKPDGLRRREFAWRPDELHGAARLRR